MKVNGEQLSIHGRQKNEIQLVKECLKKKKRKQKGENLMGRRKQRNYGEMGKIK